MDKQNLVYMYNGILLSLTKAGNSDTGLSPKDNRLDKAVQTQKDKYCVSMLVRGILGSQIYRCKNHSVIARAGGRGYRSCALIDMEFQFLQNKKVQ